MEKKEVDGMELSEKFQVWLLFGCVVCLSVIVAVLCYIINFERAQRYEKSTVNQPFRSSVAVSFQHTNRLFTGSEDVDFICISMKHRKDVYFSRLEKQLSDQGIKLDWFEGIPGKTLNLDDYNLQPRYRLFFERNLKEFQQGKTKTDYRGHFGCTVSHLTILEQAQNMTVVFEDDAEIVSDFRTKFQNALAAVNRVDPEWEVLLLGFSCNYQDHHFCKMNDREPIQEGGIVKLHYWIGGWAYCVRSKEVAQKIVAMFNPMPWHVDITLAEAAKAGNLKVYGCVETLANHSGWLKLSSWDYWQVGDAKFIKSDTNNHLSDSVLISDQ